MVSRGDAGVSDAAQLERELGEVREELLKQFPVLRQAFIFFSCSGGAAGQGPTVQGQGSCLACSCARAVERPTRCSRSQLPDARAHCDWMLALTADLLLYVGRSCPNLRQECVWGPQC
jgi:hypothetical protein